MTRKITLSLARIKAGLQPAMRIGNMDAKRDWGYAKDYVAATGETHTVREFIEKAAPFAGYEIAWEGEGDGEIGRDRMSGKVIVEVDPKFNRPAEVELLLGNPAKAMARLGWKPKVKFDDLVEIMMKADLELMRSLGS